QGVAEEELAGERAGGTLCHEGLRVLGGRGAALGPHVQDIALDVQLDRLGVDAGEVEVDEELVTRPVRVHRHGGCTAGHSVPEELLREAVEVAEGVGAHEHHGHSFPRVRSLRCPYFLYSSEEET